MAPGGSVTFTATGALPSNATGTLTNTATVAPAADFADGDGANNSATDVDTIASEADIAVTASGPVKAVAGRDLTYTLRVRNPGPSTAADVVLSDPLPAGTTFVSQTQTSGPPLTLANTATSISDTIASLAPGEMAEISLVVNVGSDVTGGTVLTNTASASTSSADPAAANNAAEVSTTVVSVLPPVVAKAFAPDTVPFIDGLSTLTITATNPADNTQTLTGVDVTDTLPPGLAIAPTPNLASTCSGTATADPGAGLVTLVGATLEVGASCTVSADVVVDTAATAPGDLVNLATVTSTEGGPGNQAQATLTVAPVTSFTGETATGTGTATASFTGGGDACTFTEAAWIALDTVPDPPPEGLIFHHGLFAFATTGCTPGATLVFTLTMPDTLAETTEYCKHGPTLDDTTPHWYVIPSTVAGDTITFSIVDGGLGDDDLTPDGSTADAGGPAENQAQIMAIPTLGPLGLLVLLLLLGLAGTRLLSRRRAAM